MVKVREDHPIHADGSVDLDLWLERLQEQVEVKDIETVRQACLYAKQMKEEAESSDDSWKDSDSYLTGLEMAQILIELNQDQDALVAAILYRSVREKRTTLEDIRRRFGQTIARLIDGVLQMAAIGSRQNPRRENVLGQSGNPLDNVRKMLVSMIDDVRVVLIKIAERTCAIRRVKSDSRKKRYLVAREVFDVYAPLAHRLGIGHIKWELEDLSFRYLKPNDIKTIIT